MELEMLVWILNPAFMEHIEHFDITTKKWRKCESTKENPCPFTHAPHKLAYDFSGNLCDCGKTMEESLKRMEEMGTKAEEVKK